MKRALRHLLLISALSAGFCASPAWSEELGQVRFTFDGVEHTWYTLTFEVRGTPRPSAQLSSRPIATTTSEDDAEEQIVHDSRLCALLIELSYSGYNALRWSE